jgi:hypothetical protein
MQEKKSRHARSSYSVRNVIRCFIVQSSVKVRLTFLAFHFSLTDDFSLKASHWKTHKPNCQSFTASNVVVIKPCYMTSINPGLYGTIMPMADTFRQSMGLSTDTSASRHNKTTSWKPGDTPADKHYPRSIVIKVQVPAIAGTTGDMFVYT